MTLPNEIGQLVNLKTLDCQHNHIEDLVDALGNCVSLSSLDLQYNQLSMPLPLFDTHYVQKRFPLLCLNSANYNTYISNTIKSQAWILP